MYCSRLGLVHILIQYHFLTAFKSCLFRGCIPSNKIRGCKLYVPVITFHQGRMHISYHSPKLPLHWVLELEWMFQIIKWCEGGGGLALKFNWKVKRNLQFKIGGEFYSTIWGGAYHNAIFPMILVLVKYISYENNSMLYSGLFHLKLFREEEDSS